MSALVRVLFLLLLVAPVSARAARFDCGQPSSTGESPTSADALAVLRASVGIVNDCATSSCICDTNGNGSIQVSDALLVLKFAVGQPLSLACNCPVTTTTSSTTTLLDLCPSDGPITDLTMDCRHWVYVYVWDHQVVEAFLTDGTIIALGQSDGTYTLYYAGTITSSTKFALALMGDDPANLAPILDAGSGGSISNGGYTLNVVVKLGGDTYKFNGAPWDSTVAAEVAAAGVEAARVSSSSREVLAGNLRATLVAAREAARAAGPPGPWRAKGR